MKDWDQNRLVILTWLEQPWLTLALAVFFPTVINIVRAGSSVASGVLSVRAYIGSLRSHMRCFFAFLHASIPVLHIHTCIGFLSLYMRCFFASVYASVLSLHVRTCISPDSLRCTCVSPFFFRAVHASVLILYVAHA